MWRLLAAVVALTFATPLYAGPIGPSGYQSQADSPWSAGSFSWFYLETFEDGLLNTPGVSTPNGGSVQSPTFFTDSVDADDGVIDGSGLNGNSFFSLNASGSFSGFLSFSFNSGVLGAYPTHAGLVWTDGNLGTNIVFEAFDASNVSLGTLSPGVSHADGSNFGGTAEDRFYGWQNAGGISRITIGNTIGGIEIDHLQYGFVPEPATASLFCVVGMFALSRRRRC